MEKTSLVIEHDFDQTTLDELATLRDVRLSIAEKQLKNPEATVDEMIRRGILNAKDRALYISQIRAELENKLVLLRKRTAEENTYYFDEIGLYSDLISEKR